MDEPEIGEKTFGARRGVEESFNGPKATSVEATPSLAGLPDDVVNEIEKQYVTMMNMIRAYLFRVPKTPEENEKFNTAFSNAIRSFFEGWLKDKDVDYVSVDLVLKYLELKPKLREKIESSRHAREFYKFYKDYFKGILEPFEFKSEVAGLSESEFELLDDQLQLFSNMFDPSHGILRKPINPDEEKSIDLVRKSAMEKFLKFWFDLLDIKVKDISSVMMDLEGYPKLKGAKDSHDVRNFYEMYKKKVFPELRQHESVLPQLEELKRREIIKHYSDLAALTDPKYKVFRKLKTEDEQKAFTAAYEDAKKAFIEYWLKSRNISGIDATALLKDLEALSPDKLEYVQDSDVSGFYGMYREGPLKGLQKFELEGWDWLEEYKTKE